MPIYNTTEIPLAFPHINRPNSAVTSASGTGPVTPSSASIAPHELEGQTLEELSGQSSSHFPPGIQTSYLPSETYQPNADLPPELMGAQDSRVSPYSFPFGAQGSGILDEPFDKKSNPDRSKSVLRKLRRKT